MRKVGGDKAADGFARRYDGGHPRSSLLSVEERRRRRVSMPGFWTRQTGNTYDRATGDDAHILYERPRRIGSDFAIIYPPPLRLPRIKDDETRRADPRLQHRLAGLLQGPARPHDPAAIIPMHHPERRSRSSNS
jgi:hypothetical protein